MAQDTVHQDIAFIRAAIEDGRRYATGRSSDMVVWGIAAGIGYLGAYSLVRGWSGPAAAWLWVGCVGLAWLYSLRRPLRRLLGAAAPAQPSTMVTALRMLWLGYGVALTILAVALCWTGEIRQGWFDAVNAGFLGAAMFATAFLANLPWLRWVAVAWWLGEFAVFALRHNPDRLLVSAVLMLTLLAGPGLVLMRRRTPDSA